MKRRADGGYQRVGGQRGGKTHVNQMVSSSTMERISAGRRGGD